MTTSTYYKYKERKMSTLSRILTGAASGVAVLGVVAASAVPAFADVDNTTAWHEVNVTTTQELVFTGSQSGQTVLDPSATGGADSEPAGPLAVRANVAWKVQWLAVSGALATESTTPAGAGNTFLTTTGFGATAANASLSYLGTNAVAAGPNVWSAQLVTTGDNQTLAFTALPGDTAATIWSGTATQDASLTPTYSADIDATLTNATYYGTIYYKLSTN
jgi:hypothetical protein